MQQQSTHSPLLQFVRDQQERGYDSDPKYATHRILTGGNLCIQSGHAMLAFQAKIADCIRNGQVLPSLSEVRTNIFCLYVDIDLKLPIPVVSVHALEEVCACIVHEVARFWPSSDCTRKCIVTTRSGEATLDAATRTYKHGVHLNWPHLHVEYDMAKQIREAIVFALDARIWTDALGVPRPVWDGAIDRSVYGESMGLRVVGCPKAIKCPTCHGKMAANRITCQTCMGMNNHHVMDWRGYELAIAFLGNERSESYERELRNLATLVRETSIRTDPHLVSAASPGFVVYDGCVSVPSAMGLATKKHSRMSISKDEKRLQSCFQKHEEVYDSEIRRVVHNHLVAHSFKYANSVFKVRVKRDSKGNPVMYRILLSGEGARYCLTKGSDHQSNNAYMDIKTSQFRDSRYDSQMFCWCLCPTPRGPLMRPCSDQTGRERRLRLSDEDVETLFPHRRAPPPVVVPVTTTAVVDPLALFAKANELSNM